MSGKRRNSSSLVPIAKIENDDLEIDERLARRLKRRRIAYQDFKVNSVGKYKGKCGQVWDHAQETNIVLVDVDVNDSDVAPYDRETNRLLVVNDNDALDYVQETNSAPFDLDVTDSNADSDYREYLDSLKLGTIGDSDVSNHMNVDNGVNTGGGDEVVESILVNHGACTDVAFADGDPHHVAIREGNNIRSDENQDFTAADFKKFSELVLFDGSGTDVNAVDGCIENDSSAVKLVDAESAKDDINDQNINPVSDMDPQSAEVLESNCINLAGNESASEHINDNSYNVDSPVNIDFQNYEMTCVISSDDKLNVDDKKLTRSIGLRQSVDNDWSAGDIAAKPNGNDRPIENDTVGIRPTENATTAGGSVKTRSANDGVDQNDNMVDPHYKMFLENLSEEGKSYVFEIAGICRIVYEMVNESESDNSCGAKENLKRKRSMQESAVWTEHGSHNKKSCDNLDPSYRDFLNSLKREGRHIVFTPSVGPKVVYNEDEESSSDSEVIVMDSDPFADKDYTPFVTSKPNVVVEEVEGSDWIETRNDGSWFKDRVVEILSKPYDHEEFERLWEELYRRRTVDDERDLRNGRTRTCSSNKIGQSYFQQYTDLGRQINSAGVDKAKVLNLLRGFFFWLQNVAHDGVFKPWMDSSCLEILPSLRRKI